MSAADARSAGDIPDLRPPLLSLLPWIVQTCQETSGEVGGDGLPSTLRGQSCRSKRCSGESTAGVEQPSLVVMLDPVRGRGVVVTARPRRYGHSLAGVDHVGMDLLGGDHDAAAAGHSPLHVTGPQASGSGPARWSALRTLQ